MKRITIYLFFSLIFLFSGFNTLAQTEKKPEFLTKETFMQKVWNYKASPNEYKYLGDKPCMIDFTASWCGWCKKIAPFMDEFCTTFDGQIYVYQINTDKEKELQSLFRATSLPTVIFFPMQGQPAATKGALPKEQYVKLIHQILLNKPETTENDKPK